VDECFGAHHHQLFTKVRQWYSTSFSFSFIILNSSALHHWKIVIHIRPFTIKHFPSLIIATSKPAYLAIKEHLPTKPVVIFTPSRRQCWLTVGDFLTHCAADKKPDLFLNIELEALQPNLDHVNDKGLVETLKHGIGHYRGALDKQDKRIVQQLFDSGGRAI